MCECVCVYEVYMRGMCVGGRVLLYVYGVCGGWGSVDLYFFVKG